MAIMSNSAAASNKSTKNANNANNANKNANSTKTYNNRIKNVYHTTKEFKKKISKVISTLPGIDTQYHRLYETLETELKSAFPKIYGKSIYLVNTDIKQKRILVEILQGALSTKYINAIRPYITDYFTSTGFSLEILIDPFLKDFDKVHKEATSTTRKVIKKYQDIIQDKYKIVEKFIQAIQSNNSLNLTTNNRTKMNVYERESLNINYAPNNVITKNISSKNALKKKRKVIATYHKNSTAPVYISINTTLYMSHNDNISHYTLARLRLAVNKNTKASGIIADIVIPFQDHTELTENFKDLTKSLQTIGGYSVPSLEYQVKTFKQSLTNFKRKSKNDYMNSTVYFTIVMEYIIAKSLYDLTIKNTFTKANANKDMKSSLTKQQQQIITKYYKDLKTISSQENK